MKSDALTFRTCRRLSEFLAISMAIPRYTLAHLITPQVCEGIVSRIRWESAVDVPLEAGRIRDDLARAHYSGGIAAVEVVILGLLDRKL